jgi:hypothetical protein
MPGFVPLTIQRSIACLYINLERGGDPFLRDEAPSGRRTLLASLCIASPPLRPIVRCHGSQASLNCDERIIPGDLRSRPWHFVTLSDLRDLTTFLPGVPRAEAQADAEVDAFEILDRTKYHRLEVRRGLSMRSRFASFFFFSPLCHSFHFISIPFNQMSLKIRTNE